MNDVKPIVVVEELSKRFISSDGEVSVIKSISFNIMGGESVAIIGPSGAGKTTLLHMLGTIEKPSSGRIKFHDQDLFAMNTKALSNFRNTKIGFVFQLHYLLPEFDAIENVMVPAIINGEPKTQARKKAEALLEEVGLGDRMLHRPGELSGGEAQRVAIARALVNGPKLVLADEPTGNLDEFTGRKIFDLFLQLNSQKKTILIIVTHNIKLAGLMDRHLYLKEGRICETF